MYRTITFVAALLTASAGIAQSQIGYVKGSTKGDAIYLINSDGTGEMKVYQAPRTGRFGGQIDGLSVSPDGSEVAFILNGSQLMVQQIDAGQPSGSAVEIAVPGDCGLFGPDYRSDGDLYVADGCSAVWLVDTDAPSATQLFDNANVSGMAALGTSLLYAEAGSVIDTGTLKLRTAGGSTTTIKELNYTLPLYMDAVGNTAVLSGRSSFRTIDLTTGDESPGCTTGGMVEYSPDGTQMVYEFRNTLFVINSDCSGAPFRLARGADAVDW